MDDAGSEGVRWSVSDGPKDASSRLRSGPDGTRTLNGSKLSSPASLSESVRRDMGDDANRSWLRLRHARSKIGSFADWNEREKWSVLSMDEMRPDGISA